MPPLSTYRNFDSVVVSAHAILRIVNESIPHISGPVKIRKQYLYSNYEIAFLKVFTGWEMFLEESFIKCITGTKVGRRKPKTYLAKVKRQHALDILTGTRSYPDWTKLDEVDTLAKLFFKDGWPFIVPLREIHTHFNEMKKIRNAIGHMSEQAKSQFRGLVQSKTTLYRPDMTAGEFLNLPTKTRGSVFFDEYINDLQIAASKIAGI